jgi:aromatic ring hydroxylase
VNECLRLIGSHNLLATPTESQLRDPVLGPLVATFLQGADGTSAETRIRVFRLAWDFAASALASRNEQYERFELASGARNRVLAHLFAPKERSTRLVERFLQEKPE